MCWISRSTSAKSYSSSCRRARSREMASMTASASPSSSIGVPDVVLIVRMASLRSSRGPTPVGMDLEKVVRTGHRQHRFDTLLNAGQLEGAARGDGLAVEVHEAADRRAVDVADRG